MAERIFGGETGRGFCGYQKSGRRDEWLHGGSEEPSSASQIRVAALRNVNDTKIGRTDIQREIT